MTDLRHDSSSTFLRRLDELDADEVEAAVRAARGRRPRELAREGIADERDRVRAPIDMHYVGQSYELTIPLPRADAAD